MSSRKRGRKPTKPTPTPTVPTIETLTDGQNTKDNKFHCQYAGYGTVTYNGSIITEQPKIVENPHTEACLVLTNENYKDVDFSVTMKTKSQNKKDKPNNWECAWVMWNYSGKWRHYYMYVKVDGGIEIGRKDWDSSDIERQIFLLTTAKDKPAAKPLGSEYNVRVIQQGNYIKVLVDDVLVGSVIDDGTRGKDGYTKQVPIPPTQKLLDGGHIGFYVEDALVEFSKFSVNS